MTRIVDVNVIFALLVDGHEHHPVAWRWWEERSDGSVVWSLPVKLGILRLLTNARAMEGNPLDPVAALDAWKEFARDPRVLEAEVAAAAHERELRRLISGREASPNLWTDAWLAALAESSSIGLTSFDAGFRNFGLQHFELLRG